MVISENSKNIFGILEILLEDHKICLLPQENCVQLKYLNF